MGVDLRETVSVIIPAYNAARFVGTAVHSVFTQGWPVEVIVVNDGSTDDLHAALRPYREQITMIDQANQGLPAARNVALRQAIGRYVLFLDADDMLGPGVIAGQVAAMESADGKGVPLCRTRFFSGLDDHGKPEPCGRWRRFPERLDIHLCHFNVAPPLAFLARRDAALAVGGFDESLGACEDHDFWLRLQGAGYAPFPGAESVVWYRRHAGSMSSALPRQWHYDMKLHQRVANLVEAGAPGFADARATRLLACCAGMLLTLFRLGLPDAAPLLPWLDRLPGMAVCSPAPKPYGEDALYQFFLVRGLSLCAEVMGSTLEGVTRTAANGLMVCADGTGWNQLDAPALADLAGSMGEQLYSSEAV